ncbi:MAG TPA: glycosyltransferase family 2 protein [Tepidisphaeraceae bacterium]|nr:glycosyltransferase family 2 protein [Tepidisphaeraceae bacterium]
MSVASQTIAQDRVAPRNENPLVSILVPCLNERLVIGEFVDWCMAGLAAAGVSGEVLIVDSSTDDSPTIATAHGATVLSVPKRGLGQAYIDALPRVRGRYVILGDCDLTYDFRELKPFVEKLNEGFEFVMGTRMRGTIEAGAMPPLHRYFGTPVTTMMLNALYGTHFSDIHCGMRAMTADALRRIDLQSAGWEYASEMVLKAARLGLKCGEIPIHFYRDREGRTSHHKRSGWLSPWRAGWVNLKAMFLFAPDALLLKPAIFALVVGMILACTLCTGPKTIGPLGFDLHWMLLGVTLSTVGYSALHLALLSRAYYGFDLRWRQRVLNWFSYNRGMTLGLCLMFIGVLANLVLVYRWWRHGLHLYEIQYQAVFGLLLIVLGWQTITHTLILHMVMFCRPGRRGGS